MSIYLPSIIQNWLLACYPSTTVPKLIKAPCAPTADTAVKTTKESLTIKVVGTNFSPTSAYLFFSQEARIQLRADGITGKAATAKVGVMWKVSGLNKTAYKVKSDTDTSQYASW